MANKRQKKKQKKRQIQQQLSQQNVSVKKLNYNQLNTLYNEQLEKERKAYQRKEQKKKRADALRKEKFDYLVKEKGLNPFDIKSSDLNKSWDFIKNIESQLFDFNKVYSFKDNERMYIAFRDFTGEHNIEDILQSLSRLSDEDLMNKLKELVNLSPTYTGRGKKGSKSRESSGRAGDYKFMVAKQQEIALFNTETRNQNRRKNKSHWQHTGDFKGYQTIKSKGRVSFDEYTPRNLLISAIAIMDNVTENDRTAFYNNFHAQIKYHNPQFAEILPEPRF